MMDYDRSKVSPRPISFEEGYEGELALSDKNEDCAGAVFVESDGSYRIFATRDNFHSWLHCVNIHDELFQALEETNKKLKKFEHKYGSDSMRVQDNDKLLTLAKGAMNDENREESESRNQTV